jgi:hypothetical protein
MHAAAGERSTSWSSATPADSPGIARDARRRAARRCTRLGVAVLFADERILTSDEEAWERWAREAVEAESYSRRLGKRIAEGYAAKRRRLGIPGGNRPPLGTVRDGRSIAVDEARSASFAAPTTSPAPADRSRRRRGDSGSPSSTSPRS